MFTVRRLKLVFGLYWLVLFMGTHTPKGPVPKPLLFPHQDKVEHFVGYAVLAWLCTLAAGRSLTAKWFATWSGIFACYAAADELTQPWVERQADVADWAADVAGVAVAFTVAHCLRRRRTSVDDR